MTSGVENIILIVVDALRTDRVGAYSGDDLTPNIDSLAEDGEIFEQCYSCINTTDPSVTTILTGQYPTRHGIINHGEKVTEMEQQCVAGTVPLPELLDSSYKSVGIDTLERWHKRGFDTYTNPRREERNPLLERASAVINQFPSLLENYIKEAYDYMTEDVQIPQSDIITNEAIDTIRSSQPFFLFAHYWDAHIPYVSLENLPEKIQSREYTGDDRTLEDILELIEGSPWERRLKKNLTGNAETVADLKRKYDAGVWRADQAIGQIVDDLKDRGIYEETAIIVTADHGESLTEHGIFFDHHGLYDPSIHVPLIVKAPNFEGREDQFVQHFDLAPTILDLVDCDFHEERFDGVSLVSEGSRTLNRHAIFAEEGHTARKRAIRTNSYKYIKCLDDQKKCRYCGISHAADEELYDLESDPQEECNIVNENPSTKSQLNEQLNSWIEQLPDSSKEETTFGTSQEVKDHLEDMGYM